MQAIAARLQAADWMGAAALAETALDAGDQGALLHKLRALRRQQAGRWAAAAQDIRAALAEWPDDFSAWNLLGFCEARAGSPQAAVAALEQAIRLKPDYAPAFVNKAWALEMLGELKEAREAYAAAADLDPADPRPGAGLALLAARAADWATARSLAEAALARDPAQGSAHTALAMADLGQGQAAAALERLDALLARPDLDPHDRAVAQGFKGDALDRLDRTDEAFAAFAAANAGLAQVYGEGLRGREGGTDKAKRLSRAFAALPPAADAEGASDPHRPAVAGHVFLLGFPRSGTTLLGQVLDGHPGIVTLDERETLADAAEAFLEPADGLQRLAEAAPAEIDRLRSAYWGRVAKAGLGLDGKVFVDKLPLNTLGLPLIARLFPQAKVVFMRRDPRDVVLSSFRQRFTVSPATAEFLTLEGAARFYDAVMALAETYRMGLTLDIRDQDYEALTTDFEAQVRALCAFIGVDWNEAMAGFAQRSGAVATPSAAQIARGLYRDGAGQWRRYAGALEPVMPILAPWTVRFGYEAP
jgi:tetratricopeptide (TPR) repeat protein